MRILVLGSGAREHAIVTALRKEQADHDIIVSSGNAGLARDATVVHMNLNETDAIVNFALEQNVDLVVIGPEEPLVNGLADALRVRGIAAFGPGKAAAKLEGSKTFAKRIMEAAGVASARAIHTTTLEEVEEALDTLGAPYVIKADGLAAGKGVLVTDDRDAAVAHAERWLGYGGVLIEEFLDGREVSMFLLCDGHNVEPLAPAQDYKRVDDGGTGPNTGGMGAYSPVPWLPESFVEEVVETIALPVVRELENEKTPFIGLLYCGLMVTSKGLRVVEFNARFGDPETQAILPRLITPLSDLLYATATGTLTAAKRPEFALDVAVAVVLASENYPDKPVTGREVRGLAEAAEVEDVQILHAATAAMGDKNDTVYAVGGRVLNVVATGSDFSEARAHAYEALSKISLEGGHFRNDIAANITDADASR